MVSPWIAPAMLIPISLAPMDDTSLWWTVYETAEGWNQDERFPGRVEREAVLRAPGVVAAKPNCGGLNRL
jgi:hypothetical protein